MRVELDMGVEDPDEEVLRELSKLITSITIAVRGGQRKRFETYTYVNLEGYIVFGDCILRLDELSDRNNILDIVSEQNGKVTETEIQSLLNLVEMTEQNRLDAYDGSYNWFSCGDWDISKKVAAALRLNIVQQFPEISVTLRV